MSAGVSAVQYSTRTGVKNKMPPAKVGTDFLASSHFDISQDSSVTKGTLKSIFKKDYIPWEVNSKPPGAIPPRPADLLQKDDRYFNEKASETKHAYEYHHLPKPERKDDRTRLGATNFKMDSDPSMNSFQTTHNRDYSPKTATVYKRGTSENPMGSFIPQGDPEKAPEPISDYRDQYRGYNASKPDKVGSGFQGPPTILGDERQHHFSTTHKDTFRGRSLPKIGAYQAPSGSSIPQGDMDKEVSSLTTHQASFPRHALTAQPYDKTEIMGKLQFTNFKQNDGHGKWNNYSSTMTDSYRPVIGQHERPRPTTHRNHSDFPPGDDDPRGNADRANMTTNRFYLGNPSPTRKPEIVSGADKRTHSNVWFGEPPQAANFYDTTTDSTFRPVSVPYQVSQPDQGSRKGVPLDYYADSQNDTTYKSDFFDKNQAKMVPNPLAVLKLKESHILAPLGGDRWFGTEHLEQFTPKTASLARVDDPGRLQRSSVPIGTLNV